MILKMLCTVIIASWSFRLFVADYKLIDIKNTEELLNFFLNGYAVIVLLNYAIVWLFFVLLYLFFYLLYAFIYFKPAERKILKKNGIAKSEVENLNIGISSFGITRSINAFDFYKNLGIVWIQDGEEVYDKDFKKMIDKYVKDPRAIIINCIKFIILIFQIGFTCILLKNHVVIAPSFYATIIILFSFLILIVLYCIRDMARLEVYVPALRKIKLKTSKDLEKQNKQKN